MSFRKDMPHRLVVIHSSTHILHNHIVRRDAVARDKKQRIIVDGEQVAHLARRYLGQLVLDINRRHGLCHVASIWGLKVVRLIRLPDLVLNFCACMTPGWGKGLFAGPTIARGSLFASELL